MASNSQKCIVRNCPTNTMPRQKKSKVFSLPRGLEKRTQWLKRMRREDLLEKTWAQMTGSHGLGVCHLHFTSVQFQTPEKQKLNFGMVPNELEVFDQSPQVEKYEPEEQPSTAVEVCEPKEPQLSTSIAVKVYEQDELHASTSNAEPSPKRMRVDVYANQNTTVLKTPESSHQAENPEHLRKLLTLPSSQTAQKVSSNFNLEPGINDRVFRYLGIMSGRMNELDRYCIIMFDEMELTKNLSLEIGESTGFVDVEDGLDQHVADHALVFMIRGIHRMWNQPVAFYFTRNCASIYILKKLIGEVIRAVHTRTSLKVVASVSDTGSWNVAAIRSLTWDCERDPNDFVYNIDSNNIFHLFDAPHLIECIRDSFIDRNIVFEDHKTAKWTDIKHVYFQDGALPTATMSKLTRKHVEPSHSEETHAKTDVQVFSHTTRMCLDLLSHHQVIDGAHTAEFVGFMNDLFDSLNSTFTSATPLGSKLTDNSPHFDFWLFCE